ncbi:cytochrome c oxidase subunit II [Bosea thiooxidans]
MRQMSWLLVALPLAACQGSQSVLAPEGDEAGRVALLSWVLFSGGAAIFLIVVAAIALALAGPESARRSLSKEHSIRIGGLAFPLVTLTVLLGYGIWLMRETIASDSRAELRIEVTGEQWWWRIAYRGRDGSVIADANQLGIPVGREVELALASADVIHSFWIPSLGGKTDMIPGRTNRHRLRAERAGTYRGQCAEYCGGPHALMALEVVAMPQADFDAWLAGRERPSAPSSDMPRRGAGIFIAAGCGACHAVDGTDASGTIGPDLSRFGARRDLAAGAAPNTPDDVARFLADTQAIKPGNLMPSFANLDAAERAALAAYLTGLK